MELTNLRDTLFSPFDCFFCIEPIVKFEGQSSESICTHHIDWNHDNDSPENVAYAHQGCHGSYHHSFLPKKIKYNFITYEQRKIPAEYYHQIWLKVKKPLKARSQGFEGHNYDHGKGDVCKNCGKVHHHPSTSSWNKGLTKETDPRVAKQAKNLTEHNKLRESNLVIN